MQTLREVIQDAENRKVAVGHFNAANIEMATAIVNAALSLKLPVIVGFSEGERDFFREKQAVDYVKSVRAETGHPIFVNADHTYSLERVKKAIDAGFDSVIWDGAAKPYEENRDVAKEAVAYARACGRDVIVEAELGFIGSGSKIIDVPPEGAAVSEETMTKPEEAAEFVQETGIDLLAPAVGNIHGIVRSGNPHLSIERIRAIREAAGVPLVLHGGSGTTDDDFRKAIAAGISQIHISTELRIAYNDAVKKTLAANPDELAPYKFMKPVVEAIQTVIESRIRLFSGE